MIDGLAAAAYTVPLDEPESDGTFTWTETTVVTVEASAGGETGLGFTYATPACVRVVDDLLAPAVAGADPLDVPGAWTAMVRAVRNVGRPGIAAMSIAAVDVALWDLKARLLGLPLARLLGAVRETAPVYGSGGFTSTTTGELTAQLAAWVHEQGIPRVKMKIGADGGRCERDDLARVAAAREAVGPDAGLFVDANGVYTRKQAVRVARRLTDAGVTWFEEPVSSDDLDGLRRVRDATDVDVAAGEYGYDLAYFQRMCPAVDVLQVDASRCAGITELLRAAAVAEAHGLDVSTHTAQSLHAHPVLALPNLRHVEYFADHHRADRLLFDGVLDPAGGELRPDLGRPGHGVGLKRADAEPFRVA